MRVLGANLRAVESSQGNGFSSEREYAYEEKLDLRLQALFRARRPVGLVSYAKGDGDGEGEALCLQFLP